MGSITQKCERQVDGRHGRRAAERTRRAHRRGDGRGSPDIYARLRESYTAAGSLRVNRVCLRRLGARTGSVLLSAICRLHRIPG